MSETMHYERTIPVHDAGDVLVVGGGPGGIAAAISAARNVARTTLVERFGFLGGNLTAGLVGPWMTSYSLDGETQLIKGVFEEMVNRMEAQGGPLTRATSRPAARKPGLSHTDSAGHSLRPRNGEVRGARHGPRSRVQLRLHTFVADAIVENGAVTGVIAASKSGLEALKSQITVDCSADADVAARAGAAIRKRPRRGRCSCNR